MPPLDALGWDAEFASAFEQLQDDNLFPARVAAQHRGEYVLLTETEEIRAKAAGRLFYEHEVGGQLPAVGDWVGVTPPATITSILPRRSAFIRKHAGDDSMEQVLAANVDAAFLLAGLDDDFSLRRLERYITTAWESGASPIVVLTKADLCDDVPAAVLAVETVAIGVPVHAVSNVLGTGLEALAPYLQPGRTVVLLGSSGVGKSTLLNRLAGADVMRTRALAADGTGRHTTVHRELVPLSGGGLVIDTPGLRELQFWEGDLSAAFEDIEALATECRFRNCAHTTEPGCAVLAATNSGTLELDRLRSWRKLQRELEAVAARTDRRLRLARKQRWKEQAAMIRQKSRR
ncbi:MAG: ribosome biosis GTPase / thiamine phosphate phosphatase [Gaiellaceae bacterium]|nr:ribosome biosis GTPase / thiamine phosphate phosphatase [Gaiellaceae bacterium]MDX6387763.1 ribosome biosis GTPase / thiamine phosphate phosphatase [Gaiellaceae bacterium]MDX6435491.1 ribosome biosis GTPase / thiamine phosphate phosphatase [Gaiellaceae bacterium]